MTLDVVLEPRRIYCLHPKGFPDGICSYCMLRETAFQDAAHTLVRSTTKSAILGAPYNLDSNIELDGGAQDGLRGYAESITKPTIVMGPLAAPEND